MTFKSGCTDDFLRIFHNSMHKIRRYPGCSRLELWSDNQDPDVFVTYSHWENNRALENYRKSELFKTVWAETRKLFKEEPMAFSSKLKTHVRPG